MKIMIFLVARLVEFLQCLLVKIMRVPGLSAAAAGGCAGRRPRRVAAPLLPVLPLLPIEVLLPLPLLEVEAERLQLLVRGQHLLSYLVLREIRGRCGQEVYELRSSATSCSR